LKKKNTFTKHDVRRSIHNLQSSLNFVAHRVRTFETLFNDYIEMEKNEDKFAKYLDGKYKQSEHNKS